MRNAIFVVLLAACSDDANTPPPQEFITTVQLAFTPMGGGTPVTAIWVDLDLAGGNPPVIDPVNLMNNTTYTLAVRFLNELETPAEDITLEIADEADAHQVFFTGTAVRGPATSNTTGPLLHTYGDSDAKGFPIGLANTMAASTGTGELIVTLRHMPPMNDQPQKTGTLAETVKTMGLAALPGEADVNVNFMVTVQ